MLAVFKPREKETRILRRSSRMTESRALVEMECELLMGLQLTESIALREGKKLTLAFLSLTSLHYETEDMAEIDINDKSLKDIWRDKLGPIKRESVRKRITKTAEVIRNNIKSLQKHEEVKQNNNEAANRQNSIIHFMATVIAEAHAQQIDKDTLTPEVKKPSKEKKPRKKKEPKNASKDKEASKQPEKELSSTEDKSQIPPNSHGLPKP